MNETPDWDDLRLFLAVARAGGLARATATTKASAPTLGRRMTTLERRLGTTLFRRRRDGYDLTAAGRELLQRTEAMEQGAIAIDRWRSASDVQPVVRIAAGAWTGAFLARHGPQLIESKDAWSIEILIGAEQTDLTRREASLGLRNRRPKTAGLAGRRLARVEFAAYGAPDLVRGQPDAATAVRFGHSPWLSFSPAGTAVPSATWLEQRLERPAVLRCSAPHPLLEAAIAGVGLAVLPCFIGDSEPRLTRVCDPIPELAHDQWLVSHDDDRHNRPIRCVADRLSRLIRSHRSLFAGSTPRET